MDKTKLIDFVRPYYADKDIMHNIWHIELVEKYVRKILGMGDYSVNAEHLTFATYFHGFIYSHEDDIRAWLTEQGFPNDKIHHIVKIAHESQRAAVPETLEGKILHDAHLIEGGKAYMLTKCLITGSIRGQSLLETINYIETNILDRAICYLPETAELLEEANLFTKNFLHELKNGIS